jgi:hypothetical protein
MISPLTLPPKVAAGDPIQAEHWNALLDAAQSLRVQINVADPAGPVSHPWKVSASEDGKGNLKISVKAGCVNDTAATVLWKVKDDPRGDMPDAAKAAHKAALAATPDSAFLQSFWDRPLHEEVPPFLLLPLDPKATGTQWTLSVPSRVPVTLRESASKEAKFYVAGVVLSAVPFNIVSSIVFPKRFRVYAGKANPTAIRQARVGEVLQLARLWQVREGEDLSTLSVEQTVFWNVSCMAVEPSLQRGGTVETPMTGLPLVDMWSSLNATVSNSIAAQANSYLSMLESTLSTTQFWTT